MDTYLYFVDNKPYLNITNKCSNDCDFCIRHDRQSMDGQRLWLTDQMPSAQKIIDSFPADLDYKQEFTFCGFGEPTENLPAFLDVGKFIKSKGGKVRLNTNGQSDLINGRSTAKEICEVADSISISLNDCTAEEYDRLCHCKFGLKGFDALLKFAEECGKCGCSVAMSVVDVIGEEKIQKCREICEKLGVKLRVRTYIPLSQY